jgi:hypothetical protein
MVTIDPGFEAHLAIAAVLLFIAFPVGLYFQRKERKEGKLRQRGNKQMNVIDNLQVMISGPDAQRLVNILRVAGYELAQPKRCLGYPGCDGDLPGEFHSAACPVKEAGKRWEW